ncbi:recombinase family protein [Streptomyces nojiriensis]
MHYSPFAEFERDLIAMRTNEGLAAARARGRTGGRKTAIGDRQGRAEMRDSLGWELSPRTSGPAYSPGSTPGPPGCRPAPPRGSLRPSSASAPRPPPPPRGHLGLLR